MSRMDSWGKPRSVRYSFDSLPTLTAWGSRPSSSTRSAGTNLAPGVNLPLAEVDR